MNNFKADFSAFFMISNRNGIGAAEKPHAGNIWKNAQIKKRRIAAHINLMLNSTAEPSCAISYSKKSGASKKTPKFKIEGGCLIQTALFIVIRTKQQGI